jgi:hypothetical protein
MFNSYTTTHHHRSIGTVVLLFFKAIKKQVFMSEILNYIRIQLRTILGVLFIKRDGVGSTILLVRLF